MNKRILLKPWFILFVALLLLVQISVALALVGAPPNDDIAAAETVTELPYVDIIDTSLATTATDDPDCGGNNATVWYKFTPGEDLSLQADTFGSNYDTTLSVYKGTPGDLTQIACNDDAGGTAQSQVLFNAESDQTYYFMIAALGAWTTNTMEFHVDVAAQAPANDDFSAATEILSLPYSDSMDTGLATTAADDPECHGNGATVWYVFTPAENLSLQADTLGSDYDTTLSVYTGTPGEFTQIACNDDAYNTRQSEVLFDAAAGTTYYFMIASYSDGPGGDMAFHLDLPTPPPANDDISTATEIVSLPYSDNSVTRAATTAEDDPQCSYDGATVWYKFTPSESIHLLADTFDSDYDTTLSVYKGAPGTLTQIACNDDAYDGTFQSQVLFATEPNQTYYFMIGSWGSAPGGSLQFHVVLVSFDFALTLDRAVTLGASSGQVTVSGELSCSRQATAGLTVEVTQESRRATVVASGAKTLTCNGSTPWTIALSPESGSFKPGAVVVKVSAQAASDPPVLYGSDSEVLTTRLRKVKG